MTIAIVQGAEGVCELFIVVITTVCPSKIDTGDFPGIFH